MRVSRVRANVSGDLFGGGAVPVDFEGVGGHGPDEGEVRTVDYEDAGTFGRVDGLNQSA